jgi:hypothetical protein
MRSSKQRKAERGENETVGRFIGTFLGFYEGTGGNSEFEIRTPEAGFI